MNGNMTHDDIHAIVAESISGYPTNCHSTRNVNPSIRYEMIAIKPTAVKSHCNQLQNR